MMADYVEPATKIDPDDAPPTNRADGSESQRDFYQRLELANRLEWNGKWRDERIQNAKDRRAVLDIVSSALELKGHQRERAKQILSEVPPGMRQGYEMLLLAFCASAFACKPDGRNFHPDRAHANNDSLFAALLDDLDYSDRRIRKCYRRLERSKEVETP